MIDMIMMYSCSHGCIETCINTNTGSKYVEVEFQANNEPEISDLREIAEATGGKTVARGVVLEEQLDIDDDVRAAAHKLHFKVKDAIHDILDS